MAWKIKSPCDKLFPDCYKGKARIYEDKMEAETCCRELNEDKDPVDLSVLGTFSFHETNEKAQ